MRGARKELPPLDLLVAFEAAARHSSFTAAAEELDLTQAAVSRQIRLLEESLGRKLFVRSHRAVQLTDQGRSYLHTVTLALNHLANASRELRQSQSKPAVTVAATHSISTLWLLPRIKALREADEACQINLISSDTDAECLSGEVDITILRGDGNWDGYHAKRLLDEEIFPVCSPDYLTGNPAIRDPRDLLDHSLIEVAAGHDEWVNWRIWLTEAGVAQLTDHRRMSVNTYPLAIQAACDGLGVALGWNHLTDAELSSGKLLRPIPESVRTKDGYYLLVKKDRDLPQHAKTFRDWLFEAV